MTTDYRYKLSNAYMYNDFATVQSIMIELSSKKIYLDKWFDMFLDKYCERMNKEDSKSPIWKKYNSKFEEYSDIENAIKSAEYYLKNMKVPNV